MAITKELTRLGQSRVKVTITVENEDVRSQYEDLVADYRKTLHIPGFRPGKAPRDVLERKLGDALREEALGRIMEKSITDIFEDETFPPEDRPLPYASPELQERPSLDLGADLNFSISYDIYPVITLGTWKDMQFEIPDIHISDEDINRELEVIRDRNAIVLDKDDDAPAAEDDVVTVNYAELSDTGEVLPGTSREDFVFTLGSGYNYFRFDDEIRGMKKDETRDIEKSYPDDFEDADLAGKHKKIRVTLTALKEKNLPNLDDDLAQDVDEKFRTLEDLKTDVRNRLTADLERRLRDIKINKILEKLMESSPTEIPDSMIRVELDARWRNFARRLNASPEEMERIMAGTGQNAETFREEWRPDVIRALHSRLIVETLLEDLELEALDEEIEKEYETIAEQSGMSLEEVKEYYTREHMKDYITDDIRERKLYDRLFAENKFIPGPQGTYLDLVGN